MRSTDLPNLITMFRIVLVAPVVWMILSQHYMAALALFMVAGISDGLDGYLAKRYGWVTRLGSLLDPLADKLLLICCYLALGWLNLLPFWLVIAVLLRDVVIATGALMYMYLIALLDGKPTLISKLNTLMQILLVMVVLFDQGIYHLPEFWVSGLIYGVLVTTVWSGVGYVWVWGRRAVQKGIRTGG